MITKEQITNRSSDFLCWSCASAFLTKDEIRHLTKEIKQGDCGLCGKVTSVGKNEFWSYEPPPPPKPNEQVLVRVNVDGRTATELQIYHCGECGWIGLDHERQVVPMLEKSEQGQIVHVCRVCKNPDFWLEKKVIRKFEIEGTLEPSQFSVDQLMAEVISENKIYININPNKNP